jgi:putative copper export protein
MRLTAIWLHLLAMAIWVGGLAYQSHVLLPAARRVGDPRLFAEGARRGRPVLWTAIGLVVLTGLYNVTRLGPLDRVMTSGAGTMLAGKFVVVLAMVSIAAQRDFGHVPRLARDDVPTVLRAIAWLDRVVLLLGAVVIYLGVAVSRLAR